jgi:glucokinase
MRRHPPALQIRGLALSPRPVLALDLGGTQIRAAVIEPNGSRLARVALETPSEEGPKAVVQACVAALERARSEAPAAIRAALAGIGLSSPGPVDPRAGVIVEPPNLGPRFRDVPLADVVEEALRLPTFIDRDTNVAALGEAAFGAGRGYADFLYITVSTGVGGAIVTDGRLFHGPDGMAGELGHLPVDMDGPMCGCGGQGHLEAVASGRALAREARRAARVGESLFLAARAGIVGSDELSAKDVAAGEDAGDAVCAAIMDRARRAVAAACVGFVNVFNPHRIIVGGSIAEHQGDRLLGPARDAVARHGFRRQASRVTIVPPELGPDVSLAGAHPLVMARLGDPAWRRPATSSTSTLAAPFSDPSVTTAGSQRPAR